MAPRHPGLQGECVWALSRGQDGACDLSCVCVCVVGWAPRACTAEARERPVLTPCVCSSRARARAGMRVRWKQRKVTPVTGVRQGAHRSDRNAQGPSTPSQAGDDQAAGP